MLAVLTVVTIGYLALTNSNGTAGYDLSARTQQVGQLREEVRRLELSALDAQSMDNLTARVAGSEFIPVAHVEYLHPETAVAQR